MRCKGFTLIELMIVVAIIIIIAAVGVPIYFRARLATNEACAISTLRTISSVQEQFHCCQIDLDGDNVGDYADTLNLLGNPGNGSVSFLDSQLSTEQKKSGYAYVLSQTGSAANGGISLYWCQANPLNPGKSGDHYFGVGVSGVIYRAVGNAPLSNESSAENGAGEPVS